MQPTFEGQGARARHCRLLVGLVLGGITLGLILLHFGPCRRNCVADRGLAGELLSLVSRVEVSLATGDVRQPAAPERSTAAALRPAGGAPPAAPRARQPDDVRQPAAPQRSTAAAPRPAGSAPPAAQRARQPRRCAIYNNVDFHLEVAAGLAWAFQEAGCAVTCYLRSDAQDMRNVMAGWFRGEYGQVQGLADEAGRYDVVVLVTFPEPGDRVAHQREMLQAALAPAGQGGVAARRLVEQKQEQQQQQEAQGAGKEEEGGGPADGAREQHDSPAQRQAQRARQRAQRFLLLAHNPEHLLWPPWLQPLLLGHALAGGPAAAPPRIQLAALAPGMAEYMQTLLQAWAAGKGVPDPALSVAWMPPLVPWQRSGNASGAAGGDGGAARYRHLCIQGAISSRRRDYAGAYAAASHPAVLAALRRGGEQLLLVGMPDVTALPPPPPDVLRPFVRELPHLPFQEYYDQLASCRAILTAFHPDQDAYLTRKSSSTIAAAVHVGTPLVADHSVLGPYSYLPPGVVFGYSPQPAVTVRDPSSAAVATIERLAKAERAAAKKLEKQQAAGSRRRRLEEQPAAPEPNSYAAALLGAFDDGAVAAAHRTMWRLKGELMRRNADVARQLLPRDAPAGGRPDLVGAVPFDATAS